MTRKCGSVTVDGAESRALDLVEYVMQDHTIIFKDKAVHIKHFPS